MIACSPRPLLKEICKMSADLFDFLMKLSLAALDETFHRLADILAG